MSVIVPTAGQARALDLSRALLAAPGHAVGVVVGYAGTGKTTLIREVGGLAGSLAVVCPTGKAAGRVREATGLEASTIHSWLYDPSEGKGGEVSFDRRSASKMRVPPSGLMVVDEASMVGPDVWQDLRAAAQELGLKILLVGDGFQLPPVQAPGAAPFSVLDDSFRPGGFVGRVVLDEILRQAEGSPIIRASMELRTGDASRALAAFPRVPASVLAAEGAQVFRRGGAIICHRNVTRLAINEAVRFALGLSGQAPEPGEPLLVTKNCRRAGLANGEGATFRGWKSTLSKPRKVSDRWKGTKEQATFGRALIEGGTDVVLSPEEVQGRLDGGAAAIAVASAAWPGAKMGKDARGFDVVAPHLHASLGYCLTGHKSQGSQYPEVIAVSEWSVKISEEEGRRWWYTTITRAVRQVAICEGYRPLPVARRNA